MGLGMRTQAKEWHWECGPRPKNGIGNEDPGPRMGLEMRTQAHLPVHCTAPELWPKSAFLGIFI